MLATVAPLSLVLLAAELPPYANTAASAAAASTAAAGEVVAGLRQRPSSGPLKRGIHELKDPTGWPAEPAPVPGALGAPPVVSCKDPRWPDRQCPHGAPNSHALFICLGTTRG